MKARPRHNRRTAKTLSGISTPVPYDDLAAVSLSDTESRRSMIPTGFGHLVATIAVCLGIALWWRQLARDPAVGWLVNIGGSLRAVLGLILLTISYFNLPIGRSY